MKLSDIDHCLRCKGVNLRKSYPVAICLNCKAIMSVADVPITQEEDLLGMKFYVGNNHINIQLLDNKTYINGNLTFDMALPLDISEEKLQTYLIFS